MYVELHSRSAFSFLEGSSLPEELIGVCSHFGMPAMALLDTDGLYGAPRFHLAADKAKVKAHIGAEVTANLFPPRSQRVTEKIQQSKINNQKFARKIGIKAAAVSPVSCRHKPCGDGRLREPALSDRRESNGSSEGEAKLSDHENSIFERSAASTTFASKSRWLVPPNRPSAASSALMLQLPATQTARTA